MKDTTIAIPLDMGKISKDFETINQFEIFKITSNKVKQSTVTAPIAEKLETILDWLSSFDVDKIFIFEQDKKATDISKKGIKVVKISKIESSEQIMHDYIKSTVS